MVIYACLYRKFFAVTFDENYATALGEAAAGAIGNHWADDRGIWNQRPGDGGEHFRIHSWK